jgi:hypothetical protein
MTVTNSGLRTTLSGDGGNFVSNFGFPQTNQRCELHTCVYPQGFTALLLCMHVYTIHAFQTIRYPRSFYNQPKSKLIPSAWEVNTRATLTAFNSRGKLRYHSKLNEES